jgi:hypothetical protein
LFENPKKLKNTLTNFNNLFSAVQFLITAAIVCAGGFLLALPYAPQVRIKLAHLLAERTDLFLPVGLMILGFGLVLLVGFFAMTRRRYFQFIVKGQPVVIETALLNELAGSVWKKYFPDDDLFTDIVIRRNQDIELIAEASLIEDPVLLENLEKDLTELLHRQIGYEKDLTVTVILK